ncbi:CAP domain-containing protein [Pannonibacter sp. Pt2-lr]
MLRHNLTRRDALRLTLLGAAVLPLAACGGGSGSQFDRNVPIEPVSVDRDEMLQRLNGFRAENGLPPLRADGRLNEISAWMANHIARWDSMNTREHRAIALARRLDGHGYEHYAAAENLGAGYDSLDAAMAGWKGSAGHRRNLLNPYVTRVGISRVRRPTGKWRHFWVMTLARPKEDGRPG